MQTSKLKTLRILQMLQQYSDEENPLSATDLIERLQNDYGIRCERKSIYADIKALQEVGFDVCRTDYPRRGFYMAGRTFELAEVRMLMDAVQSAVCRALEKQGELKEPEALRAWFYHILVHVCMDVLRSRKRVTLIPPEALDAGSYEDPLPSDGTLAQRVDALPPEVGTIIKLRFYEDLSLKEISTVTGWNLNTVKTRLYTGLKKLRISMEGDQL